MTTKTQRIERKPENTGLPVSSATLFGVPIGELGWFTSLLMGTATGFAAFFGATFLAIVGVLVYNTAFHKNVDYADTYKLFGFPIGVLVLVVALGYLGTLWVRRMVRK